MRIIAATSRNLIDDVAAGLFREDLFYRLAVGVIKLPPLRDREGDIGLLIDHFTQKLSLENSPLSGLRKKKISPNGKNILLRHSWPGNIRELQNTLTRAAVWSTDEAISEDDIREALFPASFMADKETILGRSFGNGFKIEEVVKMVEAHYLKRAMEESHGNKTKASELLGLSGQKTVTNWLKRHDIE